MAQVRYDFTAADTLSGSLRYFSTMLTDLANERERLRRTRLDAVDADPDTVAWTGGRRRAFDKDFRAQQDKVAELARQALAIKGLVDEATIAARNELNAQAKSNHGG